MLPVSIFVSTKSFGGFFRKTKWANNDSKNFGCLQKIIQTQYEDGKPILGKPKPFFINCQKV